MTDPTDTSTPEPMSDERLAELRKYADSGNLSGREARELLAEVMRARAIETKLRVDLSCQLVDEAPDVATRAELAEAQLAQTEAERNEWQRRANRGDAVAAILRADLAATSERAETAERELAEMRATASDLIGENEQLRAELVKTGEELAEMRERIGEAPEAWGIRWYDAPNQVVQMSEHVARTAAKADQSATLVHYVDGEWREVPDDDQ